MRGGNGDIKRTQVYDKAKEEAAAPVVEAVVATEGDKVEAVAVVSKDEKVAVSKAVAVPVGKAAATAVAVTEAAGKTQIKA